MAFCRLCIQKAETHYTALYSKKSLERDLPGRISLLLGISMSKETGYPDRVCRGCYDKFTTLEKHLGELKERAQTSYRSYSRKRPADDSLTPTRERQRPPAKRNHGRCLFAEKGTNYVV